MQLAIGSPRSVDEAEQAQGPEHATDEARTPDRRRPGN